MALQRRISSVYSESNRTSICKPTSHPSASMCGEETSGSSSVFKAVSIASFTAGSQCSQPQSTDNQHGSPGRTSNGSGNSSYNRPADAYRTHPMAELATTSLMSLHATQDHEPGVHDSKSHSASNVAQWLQDQKNHNRIPYIGVTEQEMGHEGSDLGDKVVNER